MQHRSPTGNDRPSPPGSPGAGGPAADYLRLVQATLADAAERNAGELSRAARLIAGRLAAGGMIHAFGSGHSHMLAEEIFYRAGGLARVDPLLCDELMLHRSAAGSTGLERTPGLAQRLLAEHPMAKGDVLIAASNSGGTRVTVELAELARADGVLVVALTNRAHAMSSAARAVAGPRLHEVADVVLDTCGRAGDAALEIAGLDRRVGPTSTVVGAALIQALLSEVASRLVAAGVDPEVFASSNTAQGDAVNEALVARYRNRVRAL
jgi:uncharacterized phosphosugar-binding protein